MAKFEWDDPTSCGDAPPDVCDAIDDLKSVRALRGTDPDSLCEVELTSSQYPAYPCVIGDTITQARSGSASHPMPMNKVQSYTGAVVPELFFRNVAGQLAAWNPPSTCDRQKVVIEDGDFTYKPDINSNTFDESCIGSLDDVDYIAGGKTFVDCNGVTRMKLVFFAKESICSYCDALES